MLYVPSHWFHHITALDPCISVNVFYENLDHSLYDPLDLYGNKDLPCTVAARQEVKAVVEQALAGLPQEVRSATLSQMISDLHSMQ